MIVFLKIFGHNLIILFIYFFWNLLHIFQIAIKSKDKSLIPCRIEKTIPKYIYDANHWKLLQRIEFQDIFPVDLFPLLIADQKLFPFILNLETDIWKDGVKLSIDSNQVLLISGRKQINIYSMNNQDNIHFIGEIRELFKKAIKTKYPGMFKYINILILFF